MTDKPALSGSTPEELAALLSPLPRFRAKQVFRWIQRGAADFASMTDLSADLRADLDRRFRVRATALADRLADPDGTVKLQIATADGARIEAVLLVDGEGRKTACLSSQVGCPMACAFCRTGELGFRRNLTAAEMVDQYLLLVAEAGGAEAGGAPAVANIVVMGMGEPLLNLGALRAMVEVLGHPDGLGLSRRRITVSTCGLIDGLRSLASEGPDVRLALSLTTADPELRAKLMPVTRANPLDELKSALTEYQNAWPKRITLEAVMLGGLNTRPSDAEALIRFARGLDVVVNLIPWNPVSGLGLADGPFREPSRSEVDQFADRLEAAGLPVTRRLRKGRGVGGACGQLGSVDLRDGDEP